MMSNVTKQEFEASLLAKVAYADIAGGMSDSAIKAALIAKDITPTLADYFIKNFTVLGSELNGSGSYQGILVESKNVIGEFHLLHRGTSEFPADLITDGILATTGIAYNQLDAMEGFYNSLLSNPAFGSRLAADTSTLYSTGHSLGGHLSTLFTLLHPDDVDHAFTFNGAGVASLADANSWASFIGGLVLGEEIYNLALTTLNILTQDRSFSSYANENITNFFVEQGLELVVSANNVWGASHAVATEDGVTIGSLLGHAMAPLTNAMFIRYFLNELGVNDSELLIKSNENIEPHIYQDEKIIEAIAPFFGIDFNPGFNGNDNADIEPTHSAMMDILNIINTNNANGTLDLAALSFSGVDATQIASWMQDDSNLGHLVRYAVLNNLPLAVIGGTAYALSTDILNDSTYDLENFSEQYLTDRAGMLQWFLKYNEGDIEYGEYLSADGFDGNVTYTELSSETNNGQDLVLKIDGDGVAIPYEQIKFGTEYDDGILGADNDDRLYGGGGKDSILGKDGDDYIEGGKGNDTMSGGDGDDTFIVQDSGDTVIELDGEGDDTIYSHVDFTLTDDNYVETLRAVNTDDLQQETTDNVDLTGNNTDNTLYGNSQDNTLDGDEADDVIFGGKGDDTLIGGSDDGNDYLDGGEDNDNLDGGDGDDELFGGEGDDTLIGGSDNGNDYLDGGEGNDTMTGGAGNDIYVVDTLGDVVVESKGEGNDRILSHINYTLKDEQDIEILQLSEPFAQSSTPATNATGNSLDNEIFGNSLHNILLGEGGEDELYGMLGNDILYGGSDKDHLFGGLGIDTYFVNGNDVIYDADGKGSVYAAVDGINDYSSRYSGGLFQYKDRVGNRIYENESSGDSYVLTQNLELIINNGSVIQDFQNGELGIYLTTESNGGTKKPKRPRPPKPPKNPRPPSVDPLVLDLDGDGVETTPLASYFDFNGDGFKTLSGFAHSDDGLLVLDINHNGFADNGRELFGDSTVLATGNIALHGFEALMEFDQNEDGVIDQRDEIFADLLVWQDINGDAVSQAEEMFSLSDLGIASFNLGYQVDGQVVNGNTYAFSSYYTKVNGEENDISAVFFGANNQHSYYSPEVDIPERLKDLPDILGTGNVYSLRVAMTLDETGQLEQLVRDYINDSSLHTKAQLTKIVAVWAGTDYTDNDYIVKLRTLEQLFGGRVLDSSSSSVNETFDNYLSYFNDSFARYAFLRDFFSPDVYDIDTNMWQVDDFNSYFESYFNELKIEDPVLAAQQQKELFESELARFQLPTVYNVELLDGSRLVLDSGRDGNLQGSEYGDLLDGRAGDDEIHAGDGNDLIEARSGDDVVYDGKGNDKINLHEGSDTAFNGEGNDTTSLGDGDDTYYAGAGSDTVSGGTGNDIYIYDSNFDKDTIKESGGNDVLRFTNGLTQSDVTFGKYGNNLVINIKENESQITLQNFFLRADYYHGYASQYRIENFEFSDGSVVTSEQLLELYSPVVPSHIYGTEGDDNLVGNDGVDQTLQGDKGNDTLLGGVSNDTLKGEEGSDTYLFSRVTGHDQVKEGEGLLGDIDTILIAQDITPADVQLFSTQGGLLLQLSDGSNSLLIDWTNNQSSIEQIVFESGIVWDNNTIVQKTVSVSNLSDYWLGNGVGEIVDLLAGDDIATGAGGDDIIAGNLGNDKLYGNTGSDTLLGGEGNDYLYGGDGDDHLSGGEGDDYLSGNDGVDILSGGLGNDSLQGGKANDVYLFSHGDGNDTISDGYNDGDGIENIVRFTADVTLEQVSFTRIHNDLIITLTATDDSESNISVNGWFSNSYYVSQLEFDNGAIITKEQILAIVNQPTEGDDYLVSGTDENIIIDGLGGDDVIKAGSGDDDVTGGEGNDIVYLGEGKNTFNYALGDGEDRIINNAYVDYNNGDIRVNSYDTIKFGAGISLDNLNITKNNYNIEFTFTDHDGKVIVQSVQSRFKTFFRYVEFADGTVLNINQIWQIMEQVEPSEIDTGELNILAELMCFSKTMLVRLMFIH
jgi:Ca2+-binding RTX toxin-like protein